MKAKYIVGILAALALVAVAVLLVENKKIEYMDLAKAGESGRRAQIVGTYVKDKGNNYDPATNLFRFTLRDEKGEEMPVVLEGAKPNNFELAASVVVTGTVEKGEVHASNILTKCPSKYEAKGVDMKTSDAGDGTTTRQN
jgi:cytochrome c-type biogenesis protein CcmE